MVHFYRGSASLSAQKGFSLIEALISFVILGVCLLGLLRFHATSQVNVGEAKAQNEAVALGEGKLQELESYLSDSDSRLNVINTSESVSGQLTTYTLGWEITDTSTDPFTGAVLKVATVTVSWVDRNNETQSVVLSSDIHFRSPSEDAENFVAVLQASDDIRDAYEAGDGDNPWVVPGTDDVRGERDIVERIAVADYGGYVPDNYEFNNVYIFRIYVTGTITRSQGANGEVGVLNPTALAVESIDGISSNTYTPSCTSSNSSYTCTLYYLSTLDGWSGTIAYLLNTGDVFCSSGFDEIGLDGTQVVGYKTYASLYESTTFNIVIATDGGC